MHDATIPANAVTRRLAAYVVQSKWQDIPDKVRREAERSFLNWLGCAVGGSRHATVERALAAVGPFAGPPQATLLGRKERLDVLYAALLNGISSHVFDFDDTHLKTVIHPSGPVAAALLALSEYKPMSGADFLHAFILGIEVECRIGNAVYPDHYDVGWHITGTAGVFGAAAAAGKVLGLSEQQMVWALGIAATQSSGMREMFGTMCKSFHPGRAAQNGLLAAFLASKDFTSSDQGIEAPRGFANVMSTKQDYAKITENLGKTFQVVENTYKPFACGIVIHPAIDGCVQLRNQHKIDPEKVAKVALKVHPLVLELTGKKTPRTGLEGKFSIYHSCAVALIHGAAGENEYQDEVVNDPKVVALRDKVEAVVDKSIHEASVDLTITMKDGAIYKMFVEHAIGSLERPMTNQDLEAKFHGLADQVIGKGATDALIKLCWDIENLKDVSAVAKAAAAG